MLLWIKTIPQVQMISPTRIIGVGVRIILFLLRFEWVSRYEIITNTNYICNMLE